MIRFSYLIHFFGFQPFSKRLFYQTSIKCFLQKIFFSQTPDDEYSGTVCFDGLAQSLVALAQIKLWMLKSNV